jgi:D-aminoacyl-tRNA deacylase
MRAVVQRVRECSVRVDDRTVGRIGEGLLIYLGIGGADSEKDLSYMADKTAHLRIFPDVEGKMNLSLLDRGLEAIVVPQFTLYGDARDGRRPSYTAAAEPETAKRMYLRFVEMLREKGPRVATGEFAASMEVAYINWGPVTILLDSEKKF